MRARRGATAVEVTLAVALGMGILSLVFQALGDTRPGAGGEIQLTDAFRKVLKERPVYAYRFSGTRFDGGDKLGFLKATLAFALRNEELAAPMRAHLEKLVAEA